jgi:hypothetical protein
LRRLLIWTFAFIVTLSILSFAPRLIGAQAKPPAIIALLDPSSCPQPCYAVGVGLPPKSLRLGDAVVFFGTPNWVEDCEYPGVLVKYGSGVQIVLNYDMMGEPLQPETPVQKIIYGLLDDTHGGDDRWRGFTQHVQCQLE